MSKRYPLTRRTLRRSAHGPLKRACGARARPTYRHDLPKKWEEYRTDAAGRRYRAKLAVRNRQGSLWGDIDIAPRSHVEKAIGQRRKQIVGDCWQLRMDADHYSDAHPNEQPIQLILDFTEDVEEMMFAAGVANKAA